MASKKNIKKTSWYKGLDQSNKNFLEKLTLDPRSLGDRDTTLRSTGSSIQRIFDKQLQSISDIQNIFRILPQLSFPRKILVSSILSPGDITKTGIVVDNTLRLSDYTLSSQMLNLVRELLTVELELPNKLSRWIDNALILRGSQPILTLPSSVVDVIMDVSMESKSYGDKPWYENFNEEECLRPIGILGIKNPDNKSESISFESASRFGMSSRIEPWSIDGVVESSRGKVKLDLPIVLTDNPRILAKALVNEFKLSQNNKDVYNVASFESMLRYPDKDGKRPEFMPSDIRRQLFKTANTKMERVLILPTPLDIAEDVNVGHPIHYELPADSTIAVTSPGDPEDHKYYIILLDDHGYFINGLSRLDLMNDIHRSVIDTGDQSNITSTLLNTARDSLGIAPSQFDSTVIDEMARINSALIESEVTRSIMSGVNNGVGKIELSENVSKLMLARTLRGKRTIMLYVPADYVTYIAFNYNEIGIGKSILEDSKSIAGMLSTLTVANVIGSVEAAIPGKVLRLKLDPNDRDPLKAATFMAREAMDLSFRRFPMGLNSTVGVAEELQMNSYSVVVDGHPAFPEVSADMETKPTTSVPIDTELMEKLNEYMHLIFSIPPELAGSANQADFATTVVTNNLMLLKTVIELQTVANKHLTRYGRNFVRYSGVMVAKFFNLIKENKKDLPIEYKDDPEGFITDFIDNIRVQLPSPETNNLETQLGLVENYSSWIDTASEAYLNEESVLMDGYSPEIVKELLPVMKSAYKNHLLRQYMRSKAILPELDIFRPGDEDNPTIVLSDEIKSHSKLVVKSIRKFMEDMTNVLHGEDAELKRVAKKDAKARKKAEGVNDAFSGSDDGNDEDHDHDTGYDAGDDDSDEFDDSVGGEDLVEDDSDSDQETDLEAGEEDEGTSEEDSEGNLPTDDLDEDKL